MYGSITVHMETVNCTEGTRIFYGPLHCRDVLPREQEVRLFGPIKAHQIQLTPRHPAPVAKEMFDTIKRGLIIEVLCTHKTLLLYNLSRTQFNPHTFTPSHPHRLKTAVSMRRPSVGRWSTMATPPSDTQAPSPRRSERESSTTHIASSQLSNYPASR